MMTGDARDESSRDMMMTQARSREINYQDMITGATGSFRDALVLVASTVASVDQCRHGK